MYKEINDNIMNLVQKDLIGENVLNQIMYLRELCNSPRLLNPDLMENGKVPEIIEIIEQISSDSKIVIFTQWKKFGDLLCEEINKKLWQYVFVHGELSSNEKDIQLQNFENNPNVRILVATDCLSYGCNLQFADTLIHADLLWNPQRMNQRNGRIHRIGQKNTANVITIMTQNTIEERVHNILKNKSDIFNQIIEGEENMKFNTDMIRQIFKDK